MRVKIFRSVFPELEEENINTFIKDVDVIDVKITAGNNGTTIVIMYKELF